MERGTISKPLRYGLVVAFIIGVAAAEGLSQEHSLTLAVRHDHFFGGCSGTLIMDDRVVRYDTSHQKDARVWDYQDIKEVQIGADRRIKLLTYEDRSNWRLGADRTFEFAWTNETTTGEQIYEFLSSRTPRPIASALALTEVGVVRFDLPAKHVGILKGNQGRLLFSDRIVVFRTDHKGGSRTWRYDDLESISSAGPYELTLTTYERQRFHYGSRRVYNFELKQPLPRDTYDSLWRFINGRKSRVALEM